MKKLLLGLLLVSSYSFAGTCKITKIARVKIYPLAMERSGSVEETDSLEECGEIAKALLGTTYEGMMYLDGAAGARVTYIIKKVKYSFAE